MSEISVYILSLPMCHVFFLKLKFSYRAKDKTDSDVLRENHRFLWRDEDEEDMTW